LNKTINILVLQFPFKLRGIKFGFPRVSENGVLRRIFGPMSDEMTEGCGKLKNEEPHNLNKGG
jgi:hypothetical protein